MDTIRSVQTVAQSELTSVANLATLSLDLETFQTPLATFLFLKRLATNLATFGKTLATFQMWPVLSCEREILSYTSPCVCSDQWALAPAERSSTFQWPHGSWHGCESAAHVQTVLPRTNHLPASPLFEIKLFNLTLFSSAFFFISCTFITHCHRALVHSSFWTPLRSLTGPRLRDCTWLYSYTTINLIKRIKLIYTYKKQNPELYHCRWCNCWFYKFSSVVWQKICNVKW